MTTRNLPLSNVLYSKSTIDLHFHGLFALDEYNRKVAEAVETFEGDNVTTIDNRSIYLAKQAQHIQLDLKVYPLNEVISKWTLRSRFRFGIAFHTETGCISLEIVPVTWGAALASRCSVQGSEFPVTGSAESPIVNGRRESTHYWPNDTGADCVHIGLSQAPEILAELFTKDVVCYVGWGTPIVHNRSFEAYLKDGFFEKYAIVRIERWTHYAFMAAADYDTEEDCPDTDWSKMLEYMCEYEKYLLCGREAEYEIACHREATTEI